MILACTCGVSKDIEETHNVGEMSTRSGFTPVFTYSQTRALMWLCPACKEKLRPAMRTIAEVFGMETDNLSWYALWVAVTKK